MKVIKLNESQYKRLLEDIGFYDETNPSSMPHNTGNKEVNPGAGEWEGVDGDTEYGKPLGGIQKDPEGKLHKKDYGAIITPTTNKYPYGLRGI